MQLSEIVMILDAEVICGEEHLDREINTGCGSDMMSDVLAFAKDGGILLTGLLNHQAVRTADMLDMRCVAFVWGKMPGDDIIGLAEERGIVLLSTRFRLFTACGLLYSAGLQGGCEE